MSTILAWLGLHPAPIQVVDSLRFDLNWGWAALVLLAILFLPLFAWFYRLEDKPHPPFLKVFLTALRVAFVAGLLLLLAGPRLTLFGMVPQKNKFAVLIDTSRSMSIKEEGSQRFDRVQYAFGHDQLIQKIESHTGVVPSLFSFAGVVSPLSRDDVASFSLQCDGDQTNLPRAIHEVAGNLGFGNLLGIMILTDGASNAGENPQEALGNFRIPLYFAGVGRAGQTRDLSVSLERPPALGFLNSKLRVRGELRVFQIATTAVSLEIRRDGKTVEKLTVPVPQGEKRMPFAFQIPCEAEGQFTYSVHAPRVENELTYENNETSFLLKVVKERVKTLALVDQANWDIQFLKQALKSDPNTHFISFVQVLPNRWLKNDGDAPQVSMPVPDLQGAFDDLDILILRGIPEAVLRPYAEVLYKRIESGKLGVFILANQHGYAPLGYRGSKLAELFPVELDGENWLGRPANMALLSQSSPLGFLRLLDDPLENTEFFRTLPKLDGLFEYKRVKGGAEILISSTLQSVSGQVPSLISHRVGRGNIAYFTGGPLWPMGFKLIPTGKGNRPYTAFIVNLLKWLANRREDAQVVLEMPSARGFVGQPATFRVWVSDTRRQPVENALITGSITLPGGDAVAPSFVSTAEKGCYEATFVPPRKGKAEVSILAKQQGQTLGEAKGSFLVETPTAEFDDPEMKTELMAQLASESGGFYLPVEQSADLLKHLKPVPGQKRESKSFELRDNPWIFLSLLLLPLLEWVIRRRRGFS